MWWQRARHWNARGAVMTSRTSAAGLIPALPRPAWVVLGGDFVSAVGSGLTLPCLFIYAHQVRHLSYGVAGLVVSTIALASLRAIRPGGRWPTGGRRGGR